MTVDIKKRREIAAKVRETMGALGQVELDGIPLADLIEPEECDDCEPCAWEVVAMEAAERLGVAVGGCLPSDYADAIEDALDRRLMPEGMEWPKVDGKTVDFVTGYEPSLGVLEAVCIYSNGACEVMGHDGIIKGVKEIHAETPQVLDADGVEICVGDKVWSTSGAFNGARTVSRVICDDDEFPPYAMFEERREPLSCLCCCLTHRAPALAADGKPLCEGETVWKLDDDRPYTLKRFDGDHVYINAGGSSFDIWTFPNKLTHEPPDSWERLEDDATKPPYAYCVEHGLDDDSLPTNEKFARDLVRRAKDLAGVSE